MTFESHTVTRRRRRAGPGQIERRKPAPAQLFFPELNEPARPTAARPVSCDTGRPAPGENGADRATG